MSELEKLQQENDELAGQLEDSEQEVRDRTADLERARRENERLSRGRKLLHDALVGISGGVAMVAEAIRIGTGRISEAALLVVAIQHKADEALEAAAKEGA